VCVGGRFLCPGGGAVSAGSCPSAVTKPLPNACMSTQQAAIAKRTNIILLYRNIYLLLSKIFAAKVVKKTLLCQIDIDF